MRVALVSCCLLGGAASFGLLWVALQGGEAYRELERAFYALPELEHMGKVQPQTFRTRMIALGAQGMIVAVVTWLLFGRRHEMRPVSKGALLAGLGLFLLGGAAVMSFAFGCLLRWPAWDTACRMYAHEGVIDASHAVVFCLAAILLGLSARAHVRQDGHSRFPAAVTALLGAAAFVAFMEEISWGQTYLGWETPESVAAWNAQNETNLHNAFNWLMGPAYLAICLWGYLATAAAIAIRRKSHDRRLAALLPAEPLYWGALWLPVSSQLGVFTDTEVVESVLAILVGAYAVSVWRQRPVGTSTT